MEDDFSILFEGLPEQDSVPQPDTPQEQILPPKQDRMIVKGLSVGYFILFLLAGITGLVCGVVLIGYELIGLASGVIVVSFDLIYILLGVVVLLLVAIFGIFNMSKRTLIDIGPEGITVKERNKVKFSTPWDKIVAIVTIPYDNQSPSSLGILTRSGSAAKITTFAISKSRLQEGFRLMQDYCQYYPIKIENNARW